MNRAAALADAAPVAYWLDDPSAPPSAPPLVGRTDADLTVVGGGYTGLWAALLAKTPKPSDDDIDAAMTGNICRCGTYQRIRAAIHDAAGQPASVGAPA